MIRIDRNEQEDAIASLQERIRACQLCQEHGYIPVAHPIVSGRAGDRILVIGQAPGHRSVTNNLPFSGPGGRILQKWLEQGGFPPRVLSEHTYLRSLTRCDSGRSPNGNGGRRPFPQESARCPPYPEGAIRHLRPKGVV